MSLQQLFFELSPPGDVEQGSDDPLRPATRVAHEVATADHPGIGAVRTPKAELVFDLLLPPLDHVPRLAAEAVAIVGMHALLPPVEAGLEARDGAALERLDRLAPLHAAGGEVDEGEVLPHQGHDEHAVDVGDADDGGFDDALPLKGPGNREKFPRILAEAGFTDVQVRLMPEVDRAEKATKPLAMRLNQPHEFFAVVARKP